MDLGRMDGGAAGAVSAAGVFADVVGRYELAPRWWLLGRAESPGRASRPIAEARGATASGWAPASSTSSLPMSPCEPSTRSITTPTSSVRNPTSGRSRPESSSPSEACAPPGVENERLAGFRTFRAGVVHGVGGRVRRGADHRARGRRGARLAAGVARRRGRAGRARGAGAGARPIACDGASAGAAGGGRHAAVDVRAALAAEGGAARGRVGAAARRGRGLRERARRAAARRRRGTRPIRCRRLPRELRWCSKASKSCSS